MNEFLLAFIPIFVAMDAIGLMPIFLGLTQNLSSQERKKVIFQSLATATGLAVGFIFLGKMIFKLLGITIGDFMIAGGIILFCIAIMDLLLPVKLRIEPNDDMGVVPIGTPLVVGPGVLTTSLMMIDLHGLAVTVVAVLLNIALVALVFLNSDLLNRVFGKDGSRAMSKVMALLLGAIAVMMVRKGVLEVMLL